MEEHDKKEERNKRIGWLTSVGVQLLLLVLFYFIVAWREPFPPIPEYGIELGFASSAGATSAAASANQVREETEVEKVIEEATKQEEVVEDVKPMEEAISEVEEVIEDTEVVTQEIEDVPIVEEKPSEETKEEVIEELEQVVDERAVMPPTTSESEGNNDKKSEGEKENKEIDERALYGNQGSNSGSTEGASLSLSGWVWDFKPKPEDSSDQSGSIVYKIVVDQDGYLVKIETVTSTVSPAVERKYRQAVEKLTFSKTGDYKSAPLSSGTITFIIKSK